MPEIRVDPLSGAKTIIAAGRAERPGGSFAVTPPAPIDAANDPFAAGNEHLTPPELHAVRPGGGAPDSPGWTVRVVPNLYPALAPDAPTPPVSHNSDLFHAQAAVGAHEVIVNAPDAVQSLSELSVEQLSTAMDVWRERMRAHDRAAYVHLIVNERAEAGASIAHTHAQLYALDFVPAGVARERERFGAYATRTMGGNLLADLVQEEVRLRERIVAIDSEGVLMAPYASRLPLSLMLAPRSARASFQADGPTGAALLHDGLQRLRRHLGASPPLNLWVRTAPRGASAFGWRIDIVPRVTHVAGLELGTGVNSNVLPPEQAAAALRAA